MSDVQIVTGFTELNHREREELRAFAEAIKDPDTRKRIIAILESAELLPL